jgi:amidase
MKLMDEPFETTAHVLRKDQVVYFMDKANPPAVVIESGDVVVAECLDCFGGAIRTDADSPDEIDHDE